MFKNLRNTIVSLLSTGALLVPLAVPAFASAAPGADIQNNLCGAANSLQVSGGGSCSATNGGTDKLNSFVTEVVDVLSVFVGVIAVIMIIVGGFRYITSNGDSNNISSAKTTIIYALIGLIFVAMAQFIVQFVLNKVTNQGS